jgi:ABC-type Fe3+-hydroxamate transport system substrate-binding protein
MQRTVEIKSTVSRIVSLVPSQTELLIDLGLKDRLVGVTKFCVHPSELRKEIQLIGGTKNAKIELIQSLNPDLIIGNKEENNQLDIEVLEHLFPTWMSDIFTLEDSLEMIKRVGEITETTKKAHHIISEIQTNFSELGKLNSAKSVLYLIWKKPFIGAARNTFIHSMLERLGLENVLQEDRYPEVQLEKVNPDFIFLSSEPFPFKEKHIKEFQVQFPESQVVLVDGEFFSWYGSRLIEAPSYFKKLLNLISS